MVEHLEDGLLDVTLPHLVVLGTGTLTGTRHLLVEALVGHQQQAAAPALGPRLRARPNRVSHSLRPPHLLPPPPPPPPAPCPPGPPMVGQQFELFIEPPAVFYKYGLRYDFAKL